MGKSDDIKAVEVRAEVRQIKTMADGSVNLILNLPEDCREQVKWLLDLQGLEVKVLIAGTEHDTR
jgi:hypothetical protein